jgi:hypothetical protein
MVGQKLLNQVNSALMSAKDNSSFLGGIHILFCGDFFQLPPVLAKPLYMKSDQELKIIGKLSQNEIKKVNGRLLWKQLTYVIFLNEQMRQSNAPEYAELGRLRYGQCTQLDYNKLVLRKLEKFPSLTLENIPIIEII